MPESKPFDAATKDLLEAHPEAWMRLLVGDRAWRIAVVNAELSSITSEADKVLRVEAPEPWLVHVEFQSSRDRTLPARLQRYNVLVGHRHGLPVLSVAVLLRREADGPGLTGLLQHRLPDGWLYHEFRYRVLRVWERLAEEILSGGIGLLPIAPLANISAGELPGVFRRIDERLARDATPDQAARIWTCTYLLMGLRYPEELTQDLFAGVRAMEDSVTYQAIMRRGRAEGRVEGRVEGARNMLLLMGRKHFGPPEPRVVAAIEAIADLERVERLSVRLFDVASWDELLTEP